MRYNQGWLLKNDTQSWTVAGVAIDPATRTRREEYNWVVDKIGVGIDFLDDNWVLDAAAGYVPTWHELPNMLAGRGWNVIACDIDQRSLTMPPVLGVVRQLADITSLPFADKSFDVVCCISVLEHLSIVDQHAAAAELIRVVKNQILVTADLGWWVPQLFGAEAGDALPDEPQLDPPVYYLEIQL